MVLDGAGRCAGVQLRATIAGLVAAAGAQHRLDVVGIDIPIGLPDAGERPVDQAARALLKGAASSVFPVPTRQALMAASYADASRRNRELSGKGISRQSYGLKDKILDVDRWVAGRPSMPVLEVHPELSFRTMAGRPLGFNKRSWTGILMRLQLLSEHGVEVPVENPAGRVGFDDVADAAAVAWTAHRYAVGSARPVLSVSGAIGEIWY